MLMSPAATYAAHAPELANSFGARSCRIRVDKPWRIWLDLIHTDPLAQPVRVPTLADPGTAVDLARVMIGRTETGRPWVLATNAVASPDRPVAGGTLRDTRHRRRPALGPARSRCGHPPLPPTRPAPQ
jgi:hypothetical protein